MATQNTFTRTLEKCDCHYQKERNWGYHLFKWTGGKNPWKSLQTENTPAAASKKAEKMEHVLIRCNGCGKELVRDVPADLGSGEATSVKK